MRHLLTLLDLSTAELNAILTESVRLKAAFRAGQRPPLLAGRILGLVFEKPSLRTRASFEAAIQQLGGSSIFLSATDGPMGQRESVSDFARSLSQYADAIVLRTFKQATVEEFARWSAAPVINGLSDQYHPCQVLGDLLTIQETFGGLAGRTVVFVGDGNNVARTLALGCGRLGIRFILSAPEGYGFDAAFLKLYRQTHPHGDLVEEHSTARALPQADVVYTDVWTSMGQESEREERRRRFADYQVNAALLAQAPAHARVMHCLPAVRGEEITDEVLDGPRSIVFEQASNRLHAQKGLLKWLLLDQDNGKA
jgi:ornithine carbamoyltransferase